MSMLQCDSCENLRQESPNLVINGFTENECSNLTKGKGLSGNGDNCEDLHDMDDCLIGMMDKEIDAYDNCDWKEFMHRFIPNAWTVHKGEICWLCGFDCKLDFIAGNRNVTAKLDESAFVAGTGVSFDRQDDYIVKPSIEISGSTYTVSGSIKVDLTTQHWGHLGLTNTGNRVEYSEGNYNKINTPDGNYTLCIIKLKKSEFPWLKGLASCVGQFVNAGCGHLFVQAVDGDSSTNNTLPGQWGNDSGRVTVSPGQIWVRVAVSNIITWGIEYGDNVADVTFRATGLARTSIDDVSC